MVGTDGGGKHRARAARHRHERQSGADLHHQCHVPLPELLRAARQGPRLPLHLHRPGGHLADHRRGQRRATASACRSSARRRRSTTPRMTSARRFKRAMGRDFDYEILSVDALGAPRAGRRPLRHRAHLHRRRRRAPDVADRRLRHEHRHRRRGRPRLEARSRASRAGAAPTCSPPTRPSGGRSACATSPKRAATCAACCRPASACPARRSSQPGAASDAARKEYGDWFAAIMRHEWFANGVMLGYRYDNSPIVLARRHAARRPTRRIPTRRPPGPAPARRMSGSTTAARRSTCSAAASCCCGLARRRPRLRRSSRPRRAARRAADAASTLDEPRGARGLRAPAGAGAARRPRRLARRRRACRRRTR